MRPIGSVSKFRKIFGNNIFIAIDALLIVLIGLSSTYLATNKSVSSTSTNTRNTSNNSKSAPVAPKIAARVQQQLPPVVAKPSAQTVNINYVTIQTGVNEVNNAGSDSAAVSSGHYAYIDGSTSDGTWDGATGGKVIFDGKIVDQGTDVVQDNIVISQNGSHFGYLKDDGTNYLIMIDNVKVNSVSDSDSIYLDGVSNDGKSYVYDVVDNSGDDVIYKSGNNVYTSSGSLYPIYFNSDLSHYVAAEAAGATGLDNTANQIILDGKLVGSKYNSAFGSVGLSNNGLHYYAITDQSTTTTVPLPPTTSPTTPINANGTASPNSSGTLRVSPPTTTSKTTYAYNLVVDGKTINSVDESSYGPNNAGVNDNGDFFFLDNKAHTFTIDNKYVYPISANDFTASEESNEFAAINEDASHYIVGNSDTKYWLIDGKSASITGDIYKVELDSNQLYVYKWSN
jgi:hypothetical protein